MPATFPSLTTERLILRPLSPDDAADLFAVFSDAETMRFWVGNPHTDLDQTRQQITDMLSHTNARQWAVILKSESRAVGVFGYLGNEGGVPGIGYILRRDLWRQGIATEALRAVVAHGFDVLGFDRVELWIHESNVASQRLAQKVGFVAVSQFHMKWPQFDEPHVMRIYGLKATQFAPANHIEDAAVSINRVVPILIVPDVRAAAEFYRDRLGFTIEFLMGEPANYAGLSRGDWTFPSARMHLSQGAGSPDAVHLFFFVGPGLDRLHDELSAAGVEILSPPENKPWGMREFTARDLNGCMLRFGMPA